MPDFLPVLVVSAASARGSLAAWRCEDPRRRVLLRESGGNDSDPAIRVPAGIVRSIGNAKVDWAPLAAPDASRDLERPRASPVGRLLIRGVAGPRIADASIIPALISGNIHAVACMIVEKGRIRMPVSVRAYGCLAPCPRHRLTRGSTRASIPGAKEVIRRDF